MLITIILKTNVIPPKENIQMNNENDSNNSNNSNNNDDNEYGQDYYETRIYENREIRVYIEAPNYPGSRVLLQMEDGQYLECPRDYVEVISSNNQAQ